MNELTPYDWRVFFMEPGTTHGRGTPLGGLENIGCKLVCTEMINEHQRAEEAANQKVDLEYPLGLDVNATSGEENDRILDVIGGSPAAKAGLAPGVRLPAGSGRHWTPELLRDAIKRAKSDKKPIELLRENNDYFQTYKIADRRGEKYPHLEAMGWGTDLLVERAEAAAVAATAAY
jgi:predicted metalloprotease with PDZ domain